MTLQENNLLNHTVNIVDWIDKNALDFFQTKEEMTKEEIIENISSIIIFNPKMNTFDFAVSLSTKLEDIDSNLIEYEENVMIAKNLCEIINGNLHLHDAIEKVKEIVSEYENEHFITTVYYTIGNAIITYDYDEDNKECIVVAIPVKYHIDIILNDKKVWSWDDYKKQNSKNKENEQ